MFHRILKVLCAAKLYFDGFYRKRCATGKGSWPHLDQRNTKQAIARVDRLTFAHFAQISGIFNPLIALR